MRSVIYVASSLAIAETASACSACVVSPGAPFLTAYLPDYAMPAALLGGVILRPFLSRAGVRAGASRVALRAAAVAAAVGLIALPAFAAFVMLLSPLVLLLVPLVTCWATLWVVRRHARHVRRGPVVAGFLTTHAVLWATSASVFSLRRRVPELVCAARANPELVAWVVAWISLVILLMAFAWRIGSPQTEPAEPAVASASAVGPTSVFGPGPTDAGR